MDIIVDSSDSNNVFVNSCDSADVNSSELVLSNNAMDIIVDSSVSDNMFVNICDSGNVNSSELVLSKNADVNSSELVTSDNTVDIVVDSNDFDYVFVNNSKECEHRVGKNYYNSSCLECLIQIQVFICFLVSFL